MPGKLRKRETSQSASILESARRYIKRGWNPVPLPLGRKSPVSQEWQRRRITVDNVTDHFGGARQNIGLQLGEHSHGLTDIDIDCREALALADVFLPATNAVFGRPSKPRSHRLYNTDLHKTEQKAAVQFRDLDGTMLVELRVGGAGKGAQSMAPPSLHPSGEKIEWNREAEPPRVDGEHLKHQVSMLAAAALLVRHYPDKGSRHVAALVLGGVLARIPGFSPSQIKAFVEAVAKAADDEEWKERGTSAAGAIALKQRGDPMPGLPRMVEEWGAEVSKRLAEWFEIERDKTEDDRVVTLARLDPIAYDQQRVAAAKELGIRVSTLDELVRKHRANIAKEQTSEQKADLEQLATSAEKLIGCEDVLTLFAHDFSRLVAGEQKNAKLLFLVGTSRLFDKPMHAAIKGPSSAGKSEIRTRVLDFFPPEDVISFTALSDKALFYFTGDFRHKILSMGEAIDGKEIQFQDYLLRELMSEGKLRYPVVRKGPDEEHHTKTIEKDGPVAFLVTTTKHKLNPENETRMLSLEVDDSEAQTRAVMRKVADTDVFRRAIGTPF